MRMFDLYRRRRTGLTLAEVIMATGFLAIFTTGLLAIATRMLVRRRRIMPCPTPTVTNKAVGVGIRILIHR